MKLPGTGTVAGKTGWIAAAILVAALALWQAARTVGRGGVRVAQFNVVCDACGHYELECEVPIGSDGTRAFPVKCPKCGEEKAWLAVMCPSCREPIPWDRDNPPSQCKHCQADLQGMFGDAGR